MRSLLAQLLDNKPGSPFSLCWSHIVRLEYGSPALKTAPRVLSSETERSHMELSLTQNMLTRKDLR